MSKPTQDSVTCPNCSTISEATMWESLNSIMNSAEVDRLLEGTLFVHECPNCHSSIELTYPCLYNDMEAHVMVQYIVNESETDEAIEIIEKTQASEEPQEDEAPIKTRIVTSHNALREKVLIFKDGLDDMAVEALKAVMKNRFIDEGQISGDAQVFYSGLTDTKDIVLAFVVDERSAETMVPQALYNRVLKMVEDAGMLDSGAYVVDSVWAELFFRKQAAGR